MLREQKFEAAYRDWLRDLRGRAYIEMPRAAAVSGAREPPRVSGQPCSTPGSASGSTSSSTGSVIDAIVDAIDPRPGEALVEIGPGRGALTGRCSSAAGALTVIELDRDLAARLRRTPGSR